MIVDWESVLLGALLGIPISIVFFGGLAWSVQQSLQSQRPGTLLILSFICRITMLLGIGFWLTTDGANAWPLVGYTLAFFLVRVLTIILAKSIRLPEIPKQENP
jgi:F1F0 ATPase subunit 2